MIISRRYNEDFVSTLAFRCGDTNFEDFTKSIYGQAVFDAQRKIIKKFNILERYIDYKVTLEEIDSDYDIPLYLNNFKAETRFIVNNIEYNQTERDRLESKTYYIRFNDEQSGWFFNYYGKSSEDIIRIYYISYGPISEESDGTPVIPDIYYDELIRRAIIEIAKYGVITFKEGKKEKYMDLLRLYSDDRETAMLEPNTDWVRIKPFQYP